MKIILTSIISALLWAGAYGQGAGSNIFTHTQSGRSYGAGHLEVYNQSAFYNASVSTPLIAPPAPSFSGSSYYFVQNNFALVYGVAEHLDLILKLGLYQDSHYLSDLNFPDAVSLTLKGGSLTFADRHMYAAGMLTLSRPMGDTHNYPLVEYSSSSDFEFGFTGAFSYYSDIYYPDNALSAHVNLGYFSHNAAKTVAYNKNNADILAGTNGVNVNYGLALIYPLRLIEFRLELSGVHYLQQPDTMIYGREDFMYITPSIRYKPLHWLSIDLGFDYRISGDKETTTGVYLYSANMGLPNYADWRAQIGLNFKIFPFAPPPKSAEEMKSEKFNQRIEYFRGMVEEREKLQNAREDIESIKSERRKIEREIKELKQALEAQG